MREYAIIGIDLSKNVVVEDVTAGPVVLPIRSVFMRLSRLCYSLLHVLLHIFEKEHNMIFMKEVIDYEAIFIFGL